MILDMTEELIILMCFVEPNIYLTQSLLPILYDTIPEKMIFQSESWSTISIKNEVWLLLSVHIQKLTYVIQVKAEEKFVPAYSSFPKVSDDS